MYTLKWYSSVSQLLTPTSSSSMNNPKCDDLEKCKSPTTTIHTEKPRGSWICFFQDGDETRRRGAGHSLWKNRIAWGHDIIRLETSRSKMADELPSTGPWTPSNVYHNISMPCTTSSAMTVSKASHLNPKCGQWPNSQKYLILPQ